MAANQRDLIFALKFATANEAAIKKAADDIKKVARQTKQAEKDAKGAGAAFKRMGLAATAAGKRIGVFARQARAAFSRMRTSVIRLQTAIFALGIGFGFTRAIQVAKEYEFQLARLSAITGNIGNETGAQFTALEQTARRLGATTEFTAGQVANGLRLLAQAGFSANEAVAAIPGTLNLAIAATTDLGTATTITANTIRGFKLDASQATEVADKLTVVTQKSNTTIALLGEALKFVAPAAQSAGQSLSTISAALGALSNAGLKGTLAGTGLRRVLVGLLNPTAAAKKAFESLGLSIEGVRPEADNLIPVLEKLRESGFSAVEAFEAFGLRGGPAALVLTTLFENVEELTVALEDSDGVAQRFADRINNTLRGSLLRLKSAFEELIIRQGALANGFRNIVDNIRGVLEAMNGTLDLNDQSAEAYLRTAETLRNLGDAVKWVTITFVELIPKLAVMAPLLLGMTGHIGLAAAALVGLGTAWWAMSRGAEGAELAIEQVNAQLSQSEETGRDLLEFAAQLQAIKDRGEIIDPKLLEDFGAAASNAGTRDLPILVNALKLANQQIVEHQDNYKELGDLPFIGAEHVEALEFWDALRQRATSAIETIQAGRGAYQEFADADAEANKVFQEAIQAATLLAQRYAQIVGGSVTQANTAIVELEKKTAVLKKEIEEGALAGALEKTLQEAGLSDIDERELDKLFATLATEKEKVAKTIEEATASGDAKIREMAIAAQKQLEATGASLQKRREEVEALAPALREALREFLRLEALKEKIDKNEKAAEAERKKARNAQKAFQRFRINQLAKIQQEIVLEKTLNKERDKAKAAITLVNRAISLGVPINKQYIKTLFDMLDKLEEVQEQSNTFFHGFGEAAKKYIEDAKDFAKQGADFFDTIFSDLEDEILKFVQTGEFSFRQLATTIATELTKIGIRNILSRGLEAIQNLFPGVGTQTAEESVVDQLQVLERNLKDELQNGSKRYLQPADIKGMERSLEAIRDSLGNLGGGPGGIPTTGTTLPATQTASTSESIIGAVGSIFGLLSQGAQLFGEKGIEDTSIASGTGIIPAILHPNEAVVPLTQNKKIPIGMRGGKFVAVLPGGRSIPVDVNAQSFQFGGSTTQLDQFGLGQHQDFSGDRFNLGGQTQFGNNSRSSLLGTVGSAINTAGSLASSASSTIGSGLQAFGSGLAVGQLLFQIVQFFKKREKTKARATGRIIGFDKTAEDEEIDPLFDLVSIGRSAVKAGAFAKGGVVDAPTLSLIGEGNTPEAIVPLPDGRSIPVRSTGSMDKSPTIVNINYNIATPNADSFRGVQTQILATTAINLERAVRRNV